MAEYDKFIKYLQEKNSTLLPLTRSQAKLIEFLFKEDIQRELFKTGDTPTIFNAVWKYLKGI